MSEITQKHREVAFEICKITTHPALSIIGKNAPQIAKLLADAFPSWVNVTLEMMPKRGKHVWVYKPHGYDKFDHAISLGDKWTAVCEPEEITAWCEIIPPSPDETERPSV